MNHPENDATSAVDDDRTVRTSWDHSTPSYSVVEAVTEVTGSSAIGMRPLYEVVDPDALDRLFGSASGEDPPAELNLSFRYEDCRVTIDADGRLVVSPSGSESR